MAGLQLLLWGAMGGGVAIATYGGLDLVAARRRSSHRVGRMVVRLPGSGRRPADRFAHRLDDLAARAAELFRTGEMSDLSQVRTTLQRAGWRAPHSAEVFLLLRIALPLLLALLAFGLANWRGFGGLGSAGSVLIAAGIGHMAPRILLTNLYKRRQAALLKSLPDGIDLLVVCVESGLGLNEAFARVGRELARAHPALADEFAITAAELALLPDRTQALHNLHQRTGLDPLRGVVTTMLQAERFGTPVAQSLRLLAGEFRTRRMLAAEERAARLPVLLTIPMMIFILPVLFIVLLGPAVLTTLDTVGRM